MFFDQKLCPFVGLLGQFDDLLPCQSVRLLSLAGVAAFVEELKADVVDVSLLMEQSNLLQRREVSVGGARRHLQLRGELGDSCLLHLLYRIESTLARLDGLEPLGGVV